jgi:hypothetical protein
MQRLMQTGVAPLGAVLNRGEMEFSYYRYSRPSKTAAPPVPETDVEEGTAEPSA